MNITVPAEEVTEILLDINKKLTLNNVVLSIQLQKMTQRVLELEQVLVAQLQNDGTEGLHTDSAADSGSPN